MGRKFELGVGLIVAPMILGVAGVYSVRERLRNDAGRRAGTLHAKAPEDPLSQSQRQWRADADLMRQLRILSDEPWDSDPEGEAAATGRSIAEVLRLESEAERLHRARRGKPLTLQESEQAWHLIQAFQRRYGPLRLAPD